VGDGVYNVDGSLLGVEGGLELDVGALAADESTGGKLGAALLDGGVSGGGFTPAVASALFGGGVERAAVVGASFEVMVGHFNVVLGCLHVLAANLHGPGTLDVGAGLGTSGDLGRHATLALGALECAVVALAEVAVVALGTGTVPAVSDEGSTVEALLLGSNGGGTSGFRGRESGDFLVLLVPDDASGLLDERLEADLLGGNRGGTSGKLDFGSASVDVGESSGGLLLDSLDFLLVVEVLAEVFLAVHGLVVKPEVGLELDGLLGGGCDRQRVYVPGIDTAGFKADGLEKANMFVDTKLSGDSAALVEAVGELVVLGLAKGTLKLDEHGLLGVGVAKVAGLESDGVGGERTLLEAFFGVDSLDADLLGVGVGLVGELLLVLLGGEPVIGAELNSLLGWGVHVDEVDGVPAISGGGLEGDAEEKADVFLHLDGGGTRTALGEFTANGVVLGAALGTDESNLDGTLGIGVSERTSGVVDGVLASLLGLGGTKLGPAAGLVVAPLHLLEDGAGVATEFGERSYLTGSDLETTAALLRALVELGPLGDGAVDGTCLDHALLGLPFDGAELATVESFDDDLAHALLKTHAAGSSARAVPGPFADLAISGAGEGVAAVGLFEASALDASVLGPLEDLAGALAGAVTTGPGALGVLAPGGEFAVDGAGAGIAVLLFFSVGTFVASVGALLDNNTGADVGSSATGLGARTVFGPCADLAIDGASLLVALLGVILVLADATEEGLAVDLFEARLVAAAAGYGAFLVGTPLSGKLAVERALLGFALDGHAERWALVSTVLALLEHGTDSSLSADTTGLSASGELGPFGDLAAHGTVTSGALGNLAAETAFLAAEPGLGKKGAGTLASAHTTALGACAEGTPDTNFAINRALLGVATRVLEEFGTFLAAEFGKNLNLADTLVSSHAAGERALGETTPLGELAVAGAGSLVAFLGLLKSGASNTTVGRTLGDDAGVGHAAATTGGRAGSPEAPVAGEAVHGAFLGSASSPLLEHGAVLTTVGGLGDNLAVAHAATLATALGAFAEFAPSGHDAVSRAGLGLAHLLLFHGTTSLAVESGLGREDTVAVLEATATGLGALGVKSPASEFAVDRAGSSLALAGLGENTTCLAAVSGFDGNLAGAGGLAAGAGLGAFSPLAPLSQGAVYSASLQAALGGLFEARASAVVIVLDDGASAALGANAADLGAGGVGTPVGDLAVDGAFASEALVTLGERRALFATVGSLLVDLAGAFHGAMAAFDVAGRVGSPRADAAVDGALLGGAITGGSKSGAGTAGVSVLADNLTGRELGALATCSRAFGPDGPSTDLAIEGAKTGFALLLFAQVLAYLTAVGSLGSDFASTLADANTACLRAGTPLGELAEFAIVRAFLGLALSSLSEGGAFLATVLP